MKVLIIEDEMLVANDLAISLKTIRPGIEIQRILESVKDAVDYLKKNEQPDLIFSDIQLGDGLSFEINREVEINVPIIFCTAYDNYAIEAFKVNGIEYILKPFDRKSLENAISKFENLRQNLAGNIAHQYKFAMEALSMYKLKESGTYMVKYRNRFLPINYNHIGMFYLENEINNLYTTTGKIFYVPESLEELEKKLGPVFFRVNRQFLINRSVVVDAIEHFPRRLVINLSFKFGKQVFVSKEKRGKVLDWLASQT